MAILGKYTKQPIDVIDYDFDYRDWLADRADSIVSHTVVADPGLTIDTSLEINGVIKVFVASGTDGQTYKVTCTVTTLGGRVKQAEITVAVKET